MCFEINKKYAKKTSPITRFDCHQMTSRDVYKFKKRLVKSVLVWSKKMLSRRRRCKNRGQAESYSAKNAKPAVKFTASRLGI